MGAKSPLLWEDGQVEEYLAGSPLVAEIKERLKVGACSDCCESAQSLAMRAVAGIGMLGCYLRMLIRHN
jgi:hypothetical protein